MITTIADQFEGWPAGLRLAGHVVATRRSGLEIPIDRLSDLGHVTDYITEEWFGGLDGDDQNLSRRDRWARRFTGPQCDEVLGRHDSASTLRHLCHDEMMLIGLDQHDEWYRMHAVLSRWLSARLRSSDPARWREIQVAAATWWLQRGDIDLAVDHAAAANDLDLLEQLVLKHAGPYAARGMYRTLERWLGHFDEARVRESLALKQVEALLSIGFGDGERALGWTRRCRSEHSPVRSPSTPEVIAFQTDALVALLECAPANELIPVARRAYDHLPPGEWRALAGLALAANMYLCGHDGAIHLLSESLFEAEIARSTTLQAATAAALAILVDLDGSTDEAAALSDRANRLLATNQVGKDTSATAVALAIASLVDARAGRHDDAVLRRDVARARLAKFDRCGPWFGVLVRVPLVRCSLLLDDAPTALALQRELDQKMQVQDATTPLAGHVDELRAIVRVASDAFTERSWALTAAELRVLQHLHTNLSLADIATRLCVSRNTVKSQVAAIYRKRYELENRCRRSCPLRRAHR